VISINIERVMHELETLASFSAVAAPAVTRVLYSPEDVAARGYLRQLAQEAGLLWREDALGNTFVRLLGQDPTLAAVATGSHIDAIPYSGRFDGVVGVLAGLEVLRALREAGIVPRRSLELIVFTAEEPTRFGLGCLGSRALAGVLSPAQLLALRDSEGQSLDDLRNSAGFGGDLATVQLTAGHYHGFIELHIEQGPLLEAEGLQIGIVSAIAAPASLMVTLTGVGGHAGATLMAGRRDALAAAAEIILALEAATLATGSSDSVGTVGLCQVHPGAINSIPSQVRLGLDIRDIDAARRDGVVAALQQALATTCARRQIEAEVVVLNADPPAQSAPPLLAAIEAACAGFGYSRRPMVSRAYHDSLFMARIAPMAMIFIPCRAGISHRPDEHAAASDIERGIRVLSRAMLNVGEQ
jgi:ureidoglycolate amidohydrolase